MNSEELKILISEGEGLTVEFKERYSSRINEDIVAFANAKGGHILLGVNDQGKITGEKLTGKMKAEILSLARNCNPHITISAISQIKKVVVIKVQEGTEKPYSCSSGYFHRMDSVTQKMTQKEVRTIFRETVDRLFEDLPRKDCLLSNISIEKVKAFLAESGSTFKINKRNLASFLPALVFIKTANSITRASLCLRKMSGSMSLTRK